MKNLSVLGKAVKPNNKVDIYMEHESAPEFHFLTKF